MTASEHTELLPCPLCGGKAEVMFVTGMAYDWRARCTNPNCGANVRFTANSPSEDDPRRAAVIAAWNKRATHDPVSVADAARLMVDAWEVLPEGRHSISVMQKWILDDLKPAVDRIRVALSRRPLPVGAEPPAVVSHQPVSGDTQAALSNVGETLATDGAEPVPVAPSRFEREIHEAIVSRLISLTVGSCSCHTMSPDLKYHTHSCRYRIAAEALELVRPLFASPTGMAEETVTAPEIANEIWEALFNETKDCVPEELTDELLAKVAEALLSGYSLQRRPRHG